MSTSGPGSFFSNLSISKKLTLSTASAALAAGLAIGGISLERAPDVLTAEPDSIAVVTAITEAPDPEAAAGQWLDLLRNYHRRQHG